MANKPIPVVPDTGTEKAARLATELTGNPGCWVRLDCAHPRHVQHMVPAGAMLDCPSCPPSVDGNLARRQVLGLSAAHHCSARLPADPHAAATARQLAAQAVTAAGLNAVLADVQRLVEELVANATRRTQAPLELTIDAHDDVVRVEVHDQPSRLPWGSRSTLHAIAARLDRPHLAGLTGGARSRRGDATRSSGQNCVGAAGADLPSALYSSRRLRERYAGFHRISTSG